MRGGEGEEQEETDFTIKVLLCLQLCSERVVKKVEDGRIIWKNLMSPSKDDEVKGCISQLRKARY